VQDASGMTSEEKFNVFLFSLAGLFIAALFGAALAGAFIATFLLLVFGALIAFGFVSASVLVAVVKRSAAAGFRTLLMLLFGSGCLAIGGFGLWLINRLIQHPMSSSTALLTGAAAGLCSGLILGYFTQKILQTVLNLLLRKLLRL
ncbi:MAG TPA: hypothetical protein VHK69_22785, partial [Chitinophagaceae bacterium]|nr:hypothetical protein [Chitinophagaceae bacterium]